MKVPGASQYSTNWHHWMPWLVLVSGLLATALTTAFVAWATREQVRLRFEAATSDAEHSIQTRLEVYRALMRGAAGLFAGSTEVSRDDFRLFRERLRISENYPGIQGIGYSIVVPPESEEQIIAAARADGVTNFSIWPEDWTGEKHAVYYLEPLDERNRAAMGYNMFSHPVRRVAMQRARDSGDAVATAKVQLVQEIDPHKQAGFLFYSPVYKSGKTPTTVQERRRDLMGFVYSPFRADNLFAGIFARDKAPELEFEVFDGPAVAEHALMHRSLRGLPAKDALRHVSRIDVAGRQWTIVYYSSPQLAATPLQAVAPMTALLGITATLLLFGASLSQASAQGAAAEQQRREISRAALRADIGAAFTSPENSLRAALQRCTDSLVQFVPAAFARIWTLDSTKNVLVLRASSGMYTHIDGSHSRVPVGKLKIGLIASQGTPHLTNDVQNDERIGDPAWARRESMVAFAGYPMLVEDRVIGVVALFAREKLPAETLETLAGITDLIAQGLSRREAEEALRAAQQLLRNHADDLERIVQNRTRNLEETVRSLESFSYSIAHDLRAPVRTIHSFASILLEEQGAHLDDTGRDYVRRINAAADRMDYLIRDLLAYNKVSRASLPAEPVSLERVVAAVLEQLEADIKARGADIRVESPMPEVMGNATLLQQVLANLVGNAMKFTDSPATPRVEVATILRDGQVRVCVKDNGIGIDPEQHRRIFGLFERLHTGAKYQGTGVGLAIVHKAVERMGGTVGVESAVGAGSTFWFELPATDNAASLPNSSAT